MCRIDATCRLLFAPWPWYSVDAAERSMHGMNIRFGGFSVDRRSTHGTRWNEKAPHELKTQSVELKCRKRSTKKTVPFVFLRASSWLTLLCQVDGRSIPDIYSRFSTRLRARYNTQVVTQFIIAFGQPEESCGGHCGTFPCRRWPSPASRTVGNLEHRSASSLTSCVRRCCSML